MTDAPRYRAFISYSHRNSDWGTWLHRGIERYRVPRALVGRETRSGPVPKRLFPVFRDREELPTASDLGRVIEEALTGSAYLVVICSPQSAQSRWVGEEIRQFKAMHGEDRVLAVIVDGEPNATHHGQPEAECFPEALRFRVGPDGALTDERTEPIAADARDEGDGREDALLKVLAGLLGVNFNDLKQREAIEARRRARRAQAIAGAMAALAVAAVVGGIFAYFQKLDADAARDVAEDRRIEAEEARGVAEERRVEAEAARAEAVTARNEAVAERDAALVAQSRFLANRARAEADGGDPSRAILLALEALPRDLAAPDRPFVPAAAAALSSALQGRTDLAYLPLGGAVSDLDVSPDGRWAYAEATDEGLHLYSGEGAYIARLARLDGGRLHWAGFSADSRHLAAETNDGITVWRLGATPEVVLSLAPSDLYDPPSDSLPTIGGATLSPDGSALGVIETTGRLSVIELATGARRSALLDGNQQDQHWFSLAWTPAGIVAAHHFNVIDVVDPASLTRVERVTLPALAGSQGGIDLSQVPGGAVILAGNEHATQAIDVGARRILATFETDDYRAIRLSPDGGLLIAPLRPTGGVGEIVVMDTGTGQVVARHAYAVSGWGPVDMAISRDGAVFDEVYSGAVYRRDLATGETLATRPVQPVDKFESFFSSAAALEGGHLLLGTWRETAAIWTPAPGAEALRIPSDTEGELHVHWAAGGTRLVMAQPSAVPRLLDAATGAEVARLGTDTALSRAITLAPGGGLVIIPAENADMAAYDAATGALAWTHGCRVLDAPRFVTAGLIVPGSCAEPAFMSLLDPADGRVLGAWHYRPEGDTLGLTTARLVSEGEGGTLFAATSTDMFFDQPARVLAFGAEPGAEPVEAISRPGQVITLARAPGGPVLATFDDGWLAAFDAGTGALLWEAQAGDDRVRLFTGGDGRFAVTQPDGFGDAGGQRIWDLATGETAADLADLRGMGGLPDPAFDSQGRWIQLGAPSGIGENAGRAVLWNTARREVTAEAAMPGFFGAADVLPDGSLLARAEGNTAGLWDADDLQRLATLAQAGNTIDTIRFSPAGDRVLVVVPEEAVTIAPLPVFDQSTIDAARQLAGRTLSRAERNRFFLPPR